MTQEHPARRLQRWPSVFALATSLLLPLVAALPAQTIRGFCFDAQKGQLWAVYRGAATAPDCRTPPSPNAPISGFVDAGTVIYLTVEHAPLLAQITALPTSDSITAAVPVIRGMEAAPSAESQAPSTPPPASPGPSSNPLNGRAPAGLFYPNSKTSTGSQDLAAIVSVLAEKTSDDTSALADALTKDEQNLATLVKTMDDNFAALRSLLGPDKKGFAVLKDPVAASGNCSSPGPRLASTLVALAGFESDLEAALNCYKTSAPFDPSAPESLYSDAAAIAIFNQLVSDLDLLHQALAGRNLFQKSLAATADADPIAASAVALANQAQAAQALANSIARRFDLYRQAWTEQPGINALTLRAAAEQCCGPGVLTPFKSAIARLTAPCCKNGKPPAACYLQHLQEIVPEPGAVESRLIERERAIEATLNDIYLHATSEQPATVALGQWTDNTIVSLEIDESWPLAPEGTAVPTAAGGGKPAATISGNAAPCQKSSGYSCYALYAGHFEVHKRYRANLVVALAAVHLHNRSFTARPTAAGATTYQFFLSSQQKWQTPVLVGLNYYVPKRDSFPGALTWGQRLTPSFAFGISASAPPDYWLGLDWEPITGLHLIPGGYLGRETELERGIDVGVTASTLQTAPTRQALRGAPFFSVGFDLGVFSAAFGKVITQF